MARGYRNRRAQASPSSHFARSAGATAASGAVRGQLGAVRHDPFEAGAAALEAGIIVARRAERAFVDQEAGAAAAAGRAGPVALRRA